MKDSSGTKEKKWLHQKVQLIPLLIRLVRKCVNHKSTISNLLLMHPIQDCQMVCKDMELRKKIGIVILKHQQKVKAIIIFIV
uniref:Uncharacterized protein n=1 Tax=uncultured bacterium TB306_p TaxID=1552137 RepID=A0A0K0LBH8_9BACT|nr:hypothetical protein [uncultured bacterium TB306_p]